MSNFSVSLSHIMRSKTPPLNGRSLALKIGKSTAHISRILTGRQAYVNPTDYFAIVKAVTSDPKEYAQLLRARLLDTILGPQGDELPGADRIVVQISNSGFHKERKTTNHLSFSPEFEQAVNYLKELAVRQPDAERWFINQMKLMGMKGNK